MNNVNLNFRMLNKLSIATVIVVSSIVVALLVSLEETINDTALASRNSQGFVLPGLGLVDFGEFRKAPIAISGNNIYVVWSTNSTGNEEVLFRSSADGGVTFADKINLSNTTAADSINAQIATEGNSVSVTWWEHNATSIEPVVRASADNGATFGPMLRLANNGTIGEST
jgi:hypothetical protein